MFALSLLSAVFVQIHTANSCFWSPFTRPFPENKLCDTAKSDLSRNTKSRKTMLAKNDSHCILKSTQKFSKDFNLLRIILSLTEFILREEVTNGNLERLLYKGHPIKSLDS